MVAKPQAISLGTLSRFFFFLFNLLFGFLVVGGEWFQMWQSQTWNGQQGAFRFVASFGLILVFVAMEDRDPWP